MKSLYRGFMMVVAAVGLAVGSQAMAEGKVTIGAPGQQIMPQGKYGYCQVINDTDQYIYVKAPSVSRKTFKLAPDQPAIFELTRRERGTEVIIKYEDYPEYSLRQYVSDGKTFRVTEPDIFVGKKKAKLPMKAFA